MKKALVLGALAALVVLGCAQRAKTPKKARQRKSGKADPSPRKKPAKKVEPQGGTGPAEQKEIPLEERLENLLSRMKDDRKKVRRSACVELEKIGKPAVPVLVRALEDENKQVRINAAFMLGDIRDGKAARPLFELWKTETDLKVRCAVSMALEKLGKLAVPVLIEALAIKRFLSAATAAQLLGRIGDPRAVDPLLPLLKHETNCFLRDATAFSLGKLGDRRAVGPLIEALKDPTMDVRKRAAMALGRIGDRKAVEPLIGLLNDKYNAVVANATKALGKIGDRRAVDPLIGTLEDEIPPVRVQAAIALGKLQDARAVAPLIAALKAADSTVRFRAAEALGKLGKPAAVTPLTELLKDPDATVRYFSALALGKLARKEAGPPLMEALNHEDWGTRRGAARALGEIGYRRAVKALRRLMKEDVKSSVRAWAAFALGRMVGDGSARKLLLELWEARNSFDRWCILEALVKLKHPKALEICIEIVKVGTAIFRNFCAELLGRIGDRRAVPVLVESLKRESWSLRQASIKALGELGDPGAIPPLIEALKDHDGSEMHCETNSDFAAKALTRLTGEDFGKDFAGWKAWLEKGK